MLDSDCIISVLPSKVERIFIAYSGGVDSHVLLHLVSSIAEIKEKITAVYIDHGLQLAASQWGDHCETVALALGVNFKCIKVDAKKAVGQSQEEVARDARYQALRPLLGESDVLLLAQHREDQMETVLLQLFRGAGVQGLSGMPLSISFGEGEMCRPFLDISKQAINDYAQIMGLHWVEDPSNQSDEFDRNFLRNQIFPQLSLRWPALDKTVARSARHCANSHKIAQDLAQLLLREVGDELDQTLDIPKLLALDAYKQQLVIRQWFATKQLRMPSEKMLQVIVYEVAAANESANPMVKGKDYRIRRYRDKLYCLKEELDSPQLFEKKWQVDSDQIQLDDGRILKLLKVSEGISKELWDKAEVVVGFRLGAEKICLPRREGHHSLKKLFQEKGIPPWQRDSIPLIYLNGELAAIADLWVSADFYQLGGGCYQIGVNV